MITALLRIDGVPFGLIANSPMHLAGTIEAEVRDNAARFARRCDAHGLPLISLCDTLAFMVGSDAEKSALVRWLCRMFVNGANPSVPLFVMVLRKGYGWVPGRWRAVPIPPRCSRCPGRPARSGGWVLKGAVRHAYRNELAAIEDAAARDAEFRRLVDDLYACGKAIQVASIREIDDVIDPVETRRWLMRGLRMVAQRPARDGKRRPFVDA
jgi:acetyl-CoA carboxylase carboxyltransferase component